MSRAVRAVAVAFLLVASGTPFLAARAGAVTFTQYDNTNPATYCGTTTGKPVTLRAYYFRYGGSIYALVELRYSPVCNTVWTRVKNLTGDTTTPGTVSARTIQADETISVYTCPDPTCLALPPQTEHDTIAPGSTAFSLQQSVRAGSSINGAGQPPTFRPTVKIYDNLIGVSLGSFDMGFEPLWDRQRDNFRNEIPYRTNGSVLSCNGSSTYPCITWGEDSTYPYRRTLSVYMDYSFSSSITTWSYSSDIPKITDLWANTTLYTPRATFCWATPYNSPCASPGSYNVEIYVVSPTDGRLGGGAAGTTDSSSGGRITHSVLAMSSTNRYTPVCGTTDAAGCPPGKKDGEPRTMFSHEWGHVLGLAHCDMDFGVMCAITAYKGYDTAKTTVGGTSYWTPQWRDIAGIKVLYP